MNPSSITYFGLLLGLVLPSCRSKEACVTRSYELTLERVRFEPVTTIDCVDTDELPRVIRIRPLRADNSRNDSCDTTPLELVGREWERRGPTGVGRGTPVGFFDAGWTDAYFLPQQNCDLAALGSLFVSERFETADDAFEHGTATDFLWTYGVNEQGEPCASWVPDGYQHCTADFRVTAIREVTEP